MIKLIDIQNHVVKKLSGRFPDHTVYREANQKEHRLPAFFVSVRPLTSTGRRRFTNEMVNVDIQYLSEKGTNQENLIMMDKLSDLFYLVLEVYDRRLHISQLSITENGGVLTVGFTLDYNTDFRLGSGMKNPTLPENVDRPPGYQDESADLGYGEGKTKKMKELNYNEGDV